MPDDRDLRISQAAGREIRLSRDEQRRTRKDLVAGLPSGIGDRTLLSYEGGKRQMTLGRFVEICDALGLDAPTVLVKALQRARLLGQSLVLRVDVHRLLDDDYAPFEQLRNWARNRIPTLPPHGVAELSPDTVRELAAMMAADPDELAMYMAQFLPDDGGQTDAAGQVDDGEGHEPPPS